MKSAARTFAALTFGILGLAVCAGFAQAGGAASQPAQAPAQTTPAQGTTPAAPAAKRPPQAKTQPEFDAYKAAVTVTDPAGAEKAADDFATKYPDSEIRILLYQNVMRLYQSANNAEKTEAMGRKVLNLDGDNPEALVTVSEVIAERTRDSDLDKDQRFGEALTMAQKAVQTTDTDLNMQAGTPQEKIDAAKGYLKSQAYSIIGTIQYKKEDFAAAQENLQKSIDAYPSDPDKVVVLRLALSLDKQGKYPEALKVTERAVDMTKGEETGVIGTAARNEKNRLVQLTGGTAPAQPKN